MVTACSATLAASPRVLPRYHGVAMGDEGVGELLVGFLERRARGEAVDFERLCAEHPVHAERLRSLALAVDRIDAGLARGAERSSFRDRLESVFGQGTDPRIELESPGEASDSGSDVLSRLVRRAGSGGRYRVQDELARGGQGAVLRVWDEDLRRNLAMKVSLERVRAEGESSRSVRRFVEEAQVTGQLDHPGIVPVHELGFDPEGRLYFVMKLVKGRDLRAIFGLVREGAEGWTRMRALGVVLKVCEALAYAHSKGVVHRDLKPANVMVGRFGEVYVMDWGLAKVPGRADHGDLCILRSEEGLSSGREPGRSDHDASLTRDGDVIGTPAYMPPEQARGDVDAIGPHSDVYAAGAMLYELLAGHAPYTEPGARLDRLAVWSRVRDGPPEPLAVLARDVPPELVAICDKAMARDALRRYRDMSELVEDLRAYLEHRVVRAYETGAVAELRKWVARNRALAAALAASVAVALLGLAATSYVEARGRKKAERSEELARDQELAAKRERANVLRLSAFQNLDELQSSAMELWPADESMIDAYVAWLEDAQRLVAGLHPDPGGDDPGHYARLAGLRERALPQSPEEREANLGAHARGAELRTLERRCEALRRALDVVAGRAEPVVFEPRDDMLAKAAAALNERAWPLVDPDRKDFGREAEGLALARLAFERAVGERERAAIGDTLAWAFLANGLAEEAQAMALELSMTADPTLEATVRGYRERLEREIAVLCDSGAARFTALEHERRALDWELSGRRFAVEEDRWWHAQLVDLVSEIQVFADRETGLMGRGVSHLGWGVERRLDFARSIEERSLHGEQARSLWEAARASIADALQNPSYAGLRIRPQIGLLPLGPDPVSGLFEFAHLQTGECPERDSRGELVISEHTGLVFVLVPGGTFWMGAQGTDPDARGYDPSAEPEEGPVHEVELGPFFLSKYEMTQAQWERFAGFNPSYYRHAQPEHAFSPPLHPVEAVSWEDCRAVLGRMGLTLPTEAQWEYAARAGTSTPWWSGATEDSLRGAVNVLDRAARRFAKNVQAGADFDDGFALHAPVSSMRPNAFGFHGFGGNVQEWCLDAFDAAFYWRAPRTQPLDDVERDMRVVRDGAFSMLPIAARSAFRVEASQDYRYHALGVRPARPLER